MCTRCTDDWYAQRRAVLPMLILDGCCGIGGITRGLASAGHEVIGVDSNPRLRDDYLRSGGAEFIHADIRDVLTDTSFMQRLDAATVSPPCQSKSAMSACRPGLAETYENLIPEIRPLLDRWGGPYTIENVSRMRPWMIDPVTLCMFTHFGREHYRHRLVEAGGGFRLTPPIPPGRPAQRSHDTHSPYGGPARSEKPHWECGQPHPVRTSRAGHWVPGTFVSVAGHERKEPVRRVMEIDWSSNRDAIKEAVPPYVGQWLAGQLELMT